MRQVVRRIKLSVVGLLVVACLALLPSQPVAAAVTVKRIRDSATFPSIQSAINDAGTTTGDTLSVSAGTDTENVTISKSVTIQGAGAASTVVDGNNAGSVFTVNSGVTVTLSGLTIQHGRASFGGGISTRGTLTVTNSTVAANSASTNGGGISDLQGPLTVTNSTFSANSVTGGQGGGGIVVNSGAGPLTVTNSTFSGNSANGTIFGGGGIGATGPVTLTNTIVANSTSGGDLVKVNGSFTGSHNLIDDATGTSQGGFTDGTNGNIVGHPALLGPLGTYGSTNGTQTFSLLPGSPAIDAGDDATCALTGAGKVNSLDQRGITRPVGAHCDIGAFESQGFTLTATSGTPQHTAVGTAFATTLAATVKDAISNPVGAGTSVTFTIVPASGAGGSFPGPATTATVTTTASGIATAPTLTANSTPGTFTVTASTPGVTDTTFTLTNDPGPATTLALSGYPSSVVAGTSNPFTVTARDAFGNTATGYTGTVHFTSTDTLATLPANYPFVPGDAGVHTFTASFGAAGTFALTATDTTTSSITGTQSGIAVTAVGTTTILTVSPSPAAHGSPVTLTATVAPATTTNLPTPTGSVTFMDGSTPLGTVTLVGGVASLTTSTLTVGVHHLAATYAPTTPGPYTSSADAKDETITAAALVSISVTPANPTLKAGQVQQFTAMGTYADNSTADLTSQVTWTSDALHVASVDTSGKGTGMSPGSAHITASMGSVSGDTSVTVSAPTAIGIAPGAAPGSRPGGASAPPAPGAAPAPAPTGR